MYPQSIRLLAHEVVLILVTRGRLNLSNINPRSHFSTNNQYQLCVAEHTKFLLNLYPESVAKELLPTPCEGSIFLTDIRLHMARCAIFTIYILIDI
jgi:hypothetical protein